MVTPLWVVPIPAFLVGGIHDTFALVAVFYTRNLLSRVLVFLAACIVGGVFATIWGLCNHVRTRRINFTSTYADAIAYTTLMPFALVLCYLTVYAVLGLIAARMLGW